MGLLVSVVCRTASLVWELLEGDNGREFEIGFPIQGTGIYCARYVYTGTVLYCGQRNLPNLSEHPYPFTANIIFS